MDATDIAFAGAAEQARMLAAGAISAPVLLELYLERISGWTASFAPTGW